MTDASEAALNVEAPQIVGIPSLPGAALNLIRALGQPAVLPQGRRLAGEFVRIAVGRSTVQPDRGDRRFADPTWTQNPAFRRLAQTYLSTTRAVAEVVATYGRSTGDDRRAEQAAFAERILTAAAAPTNLFLTNPAAAKRALETGGASVLRGTRHLVSDLRHNGGLPTQVDKSAFKVGSNLAVSPGAVVDRDELAELLQYAPRTTNVGKIPLLVIPPPIGRYYFLDLAPGRSFVEYATSQEQQVFLLSWRNPGPGQADWDLDTYAARVLRAIDTACEVTGGTSVNLVGFCAGGIIATAVLNHLAAAGDSRVNSMSYIVTLLDFSERASITAFAARPLLSLARRRSDRSGLIRGRDLSASFTWLRPDDLVFKYWVNNYLMGDQPPAFDILAWNVDSTNLPARLHRTFMEAFESNKLIEPGAMTVLGSPFDLASIKTPTFVAAAVSDHLTPWRGCYRTTQLLGGPSTFVLSYSGHIASLVNPPGNPKAHYWSGPRPGPDPDVWLSEATRSEGTWWETWAGWIADESGEDVPAPQALGSSAHPALEPAPGRYVHL